MQVWEMNPYIRYMDQRKCSTSYSEAVLAYDYRLFLVLDGMCEVVIDEQRIKLYPDSIIIIPPANHYQMFFDSQRPAVLYDINFTLNYLPGPPMTPQTDVFFCRKMMPEEPDRELFVPYAVIHGAVNASRNTGLLFKFYEERSVYCEERCSVLLKGLLIDCLCNEPLNSDENDLAVKIGRYLEEHCREALDGKTIGAAFGYHSFYLNRIFRARYGTTMHRYQTECRIRRACSMLVHTRLTIKEIADSLGFSHAAYFSEVFHDMRGMTPTQYRMQATCEASKTKKQ